MANFSKVPGVAMEFDDVQHGEVVHATVTSCCQHDVNDLLSSGLSVLESTDLDFVRFDVSSLQDAIVC